ncbi:MAG: tRNA-binding protein [Candidatus Cyclobacteriaceae bacterium M2_1C_046]
MKENNFIEINDFQKVHLQVGTIVKAENYPEARKPAYKIWVELNDGEVKTSSAQITSHYSPEELVNKQVICVTNFQPRQIGKFMSEVLITGFSDEYGDVVLAVPDKKVPNGKRLH